MGSFQVNNGSWVDINNLYVNTGSWNQAKRVYVHNGSGWVLAWENEVTETFSFKEGQTYQGTVLDSSGHYGRSKENTTRGNAALVVGQYGASYKNQRGLWIPNNGSASGLPIEQTLSGRTVASFKVSLGLAWTYWGRYHSDGQPAHVGIWGTSYSTLPTDFNPSAMYHLGTVAWYPDANAYANGYATVTAAQLGVNPPYNGDRYPVFRQDIDLTSQLSTTAKTQLTNGYIKGFVAQAYDPWNNNHNGESHWYSHAMEPGKSYETSGVWATGHADSFRIKITHTG